MNILVACEESQRVCIEFRKRGHRAFSCDIIEPSGGHPEWHIQADVLPLLNGNCQFATLDGKEHKQDGKWDMIIAFPPCTYLTITGNRWFNEERYGDKARERKKKRDEAVLFFKNFLNADCPKIAIENPVGVISSICRKPNQIIQPWMFGDELEKKTCLWLIGLPLLQPENWEKPETERYQWRDKKTGKIKSMPLWYAEAWHIRDKNLRSKIRSKTFPGVAKAMAEQWG